MPPTIFASNLQFGGIAKETVPGTPVAMAATIPITTLTCEDKPVLLDDEALRGSMGDVTDTLVGPIYSELSISGPVFVDTIPWLLRNILGDYTATGASSPFTHAFSTLNTSPAQPLTHTLTDFDGVAASHGARVYAGMALTDLDLKWNPESALFTYDAKALAWPSTIAAATPTASPSAIRAQPSWEMAVGIAGAASGGTQVLNSGEGSISIKRTCSVRWTNQGNVQNPFVIARGKIGVDGALRFIVADETPLAALLAGTIQQTQFLISGGAAQQVQVDMQNTVYRGVARDHSKELIEWVTTFKANQNTTNAGASGGRSPAKFTVLNAVNTTTY
jgi:hypothetical protein